MILKSKAKFVTNFGAQTVMNDVIDVRHDSSHKRCLSSFSVRLWFTSDLCLTTNWRFNQTSLRCNQIMNASVKSVGVKDVDQSEFVKALAEFLKKSGKLKVPEWVDLVKTGLFKELAPFDDDWFYIRVASIARHIYLRSPVGVGALTKIYGGRYRKGVRPSHYCRSSASVARKALQALEGVKWVEKDANSGGRRLTSQGVRDLDRIAAQLRTATKARLLAEAAAAAL